MGPRTWTFAAARVEACLGLTRSRVVAIRGSGLTSDPACRSKDKNVSVGELTLEAVAGSVVCHVGSSEDYGCERRCRTARMNKTEGRGKDSLQRELRRRPFAVSGPKSPSKRRQGSLLIADSRQGSSSACHGSRAVRRSSKQGSSATGRHAVTRESQALCSRVRNKGFFWQLADLHTKRHPTLRGKPNNRDTIYYAS